MLSSPARRIGNRITVPIIGLLVLLLGLFAWLIYHDTARTREDTLEAYAKVIGSLVKSHLRDAMLAQDRPRLQKEIARIAGEGPIHGVRLVDKKGRIRFSNLPTEIGSSILKGDPSCGSCHIDEEAPAKHGQVLSLARADGHIVREVEPIIVEADCVECHGDEGQVLGVLITDIDEDVLTGGLRSRTGHAVWFVAGMAGVVLASVFFITRRLVDSRVRALRLLLERLRGGARSAVSLDAPRDEIDELTRSLHAFVLDLDEQVALQRATATIHRVLEGHSAPVLLLDGDRNVVAANHWAASRFGVESGVGLPGRPRRDLADDTSELISVAREKGWALPPEGDGGPLLVSLADREGEVIAYLEAWPGGEDESGEEPDAGAPSPTEPGDEAWLIHATTLVERIRVGTKEWRGLLTVDRRLLLGGRLSRELARAGQTIRERVDLDLKSVSLLALQDVRRVIRGVEWHPLRGRSIPIVGCRYQLRALIERLLAAAGRQAGDDGHVILFVRKDAARESAIVGAWSGTPGGGALLDPPGSPPLSVGIAGAHGGSVEVDPDFDIGPIAAAGRFRPPGSPVGTLFVAEIPFAPPR